MSNELVLGPIGN